MFCFALSLLLYISACAQQKNKICFSLQNNEQQKEKRKAGKNKNFFSVHSAMLWCNTLKMSPSSLYILKEMHIYIYIFLDFFLQFNEAFVVSAGKSIASCPFY